jgi:YVTN family beta-propeller protein
VPVISGRTNTAVAAIPAGNDPFKVAVNPLTTTIYATDAAVGTVPVINGRTGTVLARVRVGLFPRAVAVNPLTNTIYLANDGDSTVPVRTPRKGHDSWPATSSARAEPAATGGPIGGTARSTMRWMAAGPLTRVHRTRPAGRLVRRPARAVATRTASGRSSASAPPRRRR